MGQGFDIAGDDGSRVSVQVDGYENEVATNSDDANWLRATIHVVHGGMEGNQSCALMTYDFATFRDSMAAMVSGQSQSSRFCTDEEWLELNLTAGPRGNVDVTGRLRVDAGSGSGLEFSFATNLPAIENLLSDINSLLEFVPLKEMP